MESMISAYLKNTYKEGDEWLWKREAAFALKVTEKVLERCAGTGTIAQMEKDQKTFYKVSDLIQYEKDKNKETLQTAPEPPAPAPAAAAAAAAEEKSPMELSIQNSHANSFNFPVSGDAKERMERALVETAEANARKAVYESSLTFELEDVANLFNLSLVDLKANAKYFRGRNQKFMITKKNLEIYLESL